MIFAFSYENRRDHAELHAFYSGLVTTIRINWQSIIEFIQA